MAVLRPQTYMNESGRSVGPARGSYKLDLDRIVVVHDEIDLPFGEVRVRLGGGLAGHNGLKSLRRELGGPDFHRVRVGVGRPDSFMYVCGRRTATRGPPGLVRPSLSSPANFFLARGRSQRRASSSATRKPTLCGLSA